MVITKIERQRRNTERFSIFIDEAFEFGLSGVDVLYYKLNEGDELTEERYNYLLNEVILTKAKDKAISFLGYRARTRKEIVTKLKSEDYPDIIIDRVIEMLEKYNYINDYEFAKGYVETRQRVKGLGNQRLRHELLEKGIDRELADEVIAEVSEETGFDETDEAVKKLEKKARGNMDFDEKEKRRIYDYLLRQGFTYDVVNRAFKIYLENGD